MREVSGGRAEPGTERAKRGAGKEGCWGKRQGLRELQPACFVPTTAFSHSHAEKWEQGAGGCRCPATSDVVGTRRQSASCLPGCPGVRGGQERTPDAGRPVGRGHSAIVRQGKFREGCGGATPSGRANSCFLRLPLVSLLCCLLKGIYASYVETVLL